MSVREALFVLALAAPIGCDPSAPPAPASSAPAKAPAAASASASAAAPAPALAPTTGASTAPPAPPPGDAGVTPPKVCEVEISGHVKMPRTPPGTPIPQTIVAIGDCLGDGKVVGRGGTTDSRFFIEVFVPWGSDLSICAASAAAPDQPSTLYGKAKIPMHAEKAGEVEFRDVVIELAKGPPKTFGAVTH
jgi:hypothetical protein